LVGLYVIASDFALDVFTSLDGKMYVEMGTGIDNILKFFRLDLVWRVLPQPLPENNYQRFGVFGSFRIGF
jgi:hypothetical protein